ncbi:GGDEF domain-containing protein [Azospirillum halopraeferens]|uniref:GGDEF domain-containing protein n=1 Tax=Azospirillum halopraeferens TaxID=34010 RepID=UPI0012EC7D31|nr:diguanylate cyclase [Azospirillum halopraeferens]
MAALSAVVGGGTLWQLRVIERESRVIERVHLPRVAVAQRIIEDAGAVANYGSQFARAPTRGERATLEERIEGRIRAMEEGLDTLRGSGEEPAVLHALRDALDEVAAGTATLRALTEAHADATRRLDRRLADLRRAAMDPAGPPPDGAATLRALAATAPSRLLLDRLAAALEAQAAESGRDPAADELIAARRDQLDPGVRIANLDRARWESSARLGALAAGYAAAARAGHDRQSAHVSELIDRLMAGLVASLAAAVLLIAALSRWFARTVIVPIERLAAATRRIAAGDLAVGVPHPPAVTEVCELAAALAAFRDGTRELRDQRDALAWRTVALDAAAEAVIITDPRGIIEYVNPAFTTLTGYAADEAIGRSTSFLGSGRQDAAFYGDLWRTISRGETWRGEMVNRRRDGTLFTQATTIAPVMGADGTPVRYVAVERDVSDTKRLQEELRRLAVTDPLTGLHNRRHLMEIGAAEADRARRYGQPLSLLIIDLDHFKTINDRYGHAFGDRALRTVAEACRALVRGVDVVARLGGEEFVVVLPQTDAAGAADLAERLRRAIEGVALPVGDGGAVRLTASIGVAALAGVAGGFEDLLLAADRALYRAKGEGRNRVCPAEPAYGSA